MIFGDLARTPTAMYQAQRRFPVPGVRNILAAGVVAPNPAPPGKTLNLQLPEVPVRPLSAYALEEVQ